MKKQKIVNIPIADLIPSEYNPRKISDKDFQDLKESLKKFSAVEPAVININPDRRNIIVGGHQRIKAYKSLGWIEYPCITVDLNQEDEKELNIRLNKNNGEFVPELLEKFFKVDNLVDWGFSSDEIDWNVDSDNEGLTDEDDIPEEIEEPVCKLGDLWELGKHRLLCGDSTVESHVSRLMGGEKAVLMVTDPPYGVEYDPEWRTKINDQKTHGKKIINDKEFDWYDSYKYFNGNVMYVWHAVRYSKETAISIEKCGFELFYLIIWNKDLAVFGRGDYHHKHEPCWYAVKKGKNHNWQGSRKEKTVWEIPTIHSFKEGKNAKEWDLVGHANQKPVQCMQKPIENNSKSGDIIYDPFLGSGTTIVACEKTNRVCYGIELDPSYCDIIIKRWEDFTGKKANKADEIPETF
jgi:DNA modification methylase